MDYVRYAVNSDFCLEDFDVILREMFTINETDRPMSKKATKRAFMTVYGAEDRGRYRRIIRPGPPRGGRLR